MEIKLDLPFTQSSKLTLRQYHERRNKVLIIREVPAIGDLLMLRMIFEDMKQIAPDIEITVAVPKGTEPALAGHPFIDKVISTLDIRLADYTLSYNLTSACIRRENITAPNGTEHRSDIWANHCGFSLTHHNMHLTVADDVTQKCRAILDSYQTEIHKPIILFSPIASIPSRSLDQQQAQGIIDELREMGYFVLLLHKKPLDSIIAPTIIAPTIIDFLGFINATDYIITVDTGSFHAAGGLNKPTVAIFSWTDGKVYGKWYNNFILVQRHRDNKNWPCGPCYNWHKCPKESGDRKPCITTITVEEVIEAVKQMVVRWPLENKYK